MFKRSLLIGALIISLGMLYSNTAFAQGGWLFNKWSVGVTVICDECTAEGDTFVADIFGLPADEGVDNCGTVKGDLYCTLSGYPADSCALETGFSDALVLAADLNLIKPKTKPYKWTDYEVNSDLAAKGFRGQLRIFANTYAISNDPAVFTIELPTGESFNKAGIIGISQATVDYWKTVGPTYSDDNAALRAFVGDWDGNLFIPHDGFGINGEQFLKNLPSLIQIWGADHQALVGHQACIVVHTDNLLGDDFVGNFRGTIGARFLSATDSSVTFEALDADEICNLHLTNDIAGITTAAVANTTASGCYVAEDVVFAPAPCDAVTYTDDAFPAQEGTISNISGVFKDTAEVELDTAFADCPAGATLYKFMPKDRGTGTYADWAFIGTIESGELNDELDLDVKVICGETIPGGIPGVEYSRYGCVPLGDVLDPAVIPDCCGCSEWVQEP
jgi:hypothetical protein